MVREIYEQRESAEGLKQRAAATQLCLGKVLVWTMSNIRVFWDVKGHKVLPGTCANEVLGELGTVYKPSSTSIGRKDS